MAQGQPGFRARTGLIGIALVGHLVGCPATWGATFYVAPRGADAEGCSAAAPCATVRRVSELVAAGDTVVALAGPEADDWVAGLLRAPDLASGRYAGLLVEEARDRRDVRGFVRLATTWATELEPVFPSAAQAIPNLVDAVNRQTRLAASVGEHLFVGSPEFFRSPFVYLTAATAFVLTEPETRALGRYLREGGFVLADNALSMFEHSQAEASLRQVFRAALGSSGQLRRIPDNHPLYHSFYDFDGPPPGLEEAVQSYALEGIFLQDRLVAVFADQGYVHSWAQAYGNEAQLRFGVNAVVFALTQPGSVARQVRLLIRRPG
ncbi:MAG: DUF4159 domain-containing protein [Candidatus Latescibacterota bacterium]